MCIKKDLFQLFLFLLLVPAMVFGASYDCDKAKTKIEKMICGKAELSRLDDQLGALYRQAKAMSNDEMDLKSKQREWMRKRNRCADTSCLMAAYGERIAELRKQSLISFDPKRWVAERERQIKAVLEDKELYIPERVPSNTPFCHRLMKNVKTLSGMEIIAPVVIADGLDAPEVKKQIFDRCPEFYNRWGLEYPRKVVLYNVDIDNNSTNGTEWLLADQYITPISPRWGDELLVDNNYWVLYLDECRHGGSTSVGGSQRYAPETNPMSITLDTGIHGVLRYQGKYYIYDVVDEPKVTPFGIQEYIREEQDAKSKCYFHEIRR